MIEPYQKDHVLLADIDAYRGQPGFGLWWLGQSGYLLQHGRAHALIDPYLSDSLTRKYAGTQKPHTRMTQRVIEPEALGFVDVVSSSHNHTDHFDPDTLVPLLRANPQLPVVLPAANLETAKQRLGDVDARLVGVDDSRSVTLGPFTFHAIPAAHELIDRDPQGRCLYLGYIVEFGGYRVYHSGDTVRYDTMAERLRPYKPHVAILPINGRRPERRVAGNLWGDEAAQLAHDIGAAVAIPCHYEMFEFNTEPTDLFVETCERLGQRYRLLHAGERYSVSPTASA